MYNFMWILITLYHQLYTVTSTVNLALNKKAWLSTNYSDHSADRAVDGSRNQVLSYGSCAHSDEGQTSAYWGVDLESIHSIHRIDIYYRDGFRSRFAGFFLYISNSTNKEDGILCYHEMQDGVSFPPLVMSIECIHYGRYVILYNERRNDVTYPSSYSTDAIVEPCEVEVYGKYTSVYGAVVLTPFRSDICKQVGILPCDYCIKTGCPSNCLKDQCDSVNGKCFGCVPGFYGPYCDQPCSYIWKYGPSCTHKCGNCLHGGRCDNVNGTCHKGCAPGWIGDKCAIKEKKCESPPTKCETCSRFALKLEAPAYMLKRIETTETKVSCFKMCAGDPECHAFAYEENSSKCRLFYDEEDHDATPIPVYSRVHIPN